jgi:hypothetical protein
VDLKTTYRQPTAQNAHILRSSSCSGAQREPQATECLPPTAINPSVKRHTKQQKHTHRLHLYTNTTTYVLISIAFLANKQKRP